MPIPRQQQGESREQFMQRCMADRVMVDEFPDPGQRFAVCERQLIGKSRVNKAYKPRKWATIDRKRASFRRKYRPKMAEALDKSIEGIWDMIERTDVQNMKDKSIFVDSEPVRELYKELYSDVGKYFALFDRRQALKNAGIRYQTKEDEEAKVESLIMQQMIAFAESDYIASNIQVVADTSREFLENMIKQVTAEVIDEGYGAGRAQTELRDRLKNQWHRAMRYRTERIVRTETTTAASKGSLEGVRATGVPHNKIWVASFGSDTRQWHADANGQKVDINEDFMVMGQGMDGPGDPRGTAANVINCRCTVTYEAK